MPAETEIVANRYFDFGLAHFIGHIVKIAIRVGIVIIDCWRDLTIAD